MKRLVIAIDCNDVLVSTAESTINYYNAIYGTSLTLEHLYKPATLADWTAILNEVHYAAR